MSMSIHSAAASFATAARRLVDLDEDDDAEDTAAGIASLTPEAACAVLERAAHRSGPHRIEIGPCPHATPGDPRCDACLAVARKDP